MILSKNFETTVQYETENPMQNAIKQIQKLSCNIYENKLFETNPS